AAPAARYHLALPGVDQVRHLLAGFGAGDDRPDRHRHLDILAVLTAALVPGAVAAAAGAKITVVPEIDERGQARVGEQNDAASAPAVATIGPAARHMLLTPEADGPGTAGPRPGADRGFVEEHS